MPVRFNTVQIANFNQVNLIVQGDGLGSILKFSLSLPPFNISFNGVPPDFCKVQVQSQTITATADITEPTAGNYILTITFNIAPPSDRTLGIEVDFSYDTL